MSLYDGAWSQDIKSGQIQNIPSFEKGSENIMCFVYCISERKRLFLFNNEEFNCSQSKYRTVITMQDKVDYPYLDYSFVSLPKVLDLLPHFILIISTCDSESGSVVPDSLWPHGLYSPWHSLGQNTGVGCLFLLQGIFPTQEWNRSLLHSEKSCPLNFHFTV